MTHTAPAIVTDGLTKDFGSFRAVDDLTVEVPRGGVVGLLGPNGAGKSTTIRMLLGLIAPTAGCGEVLGADIRQPGAFLDRVGALIESPTFYPKLSGTENLRSFAVLGGADRSSVVECLEMVGLRDRAEDRYSDYSLGMKQRLGIAAAMLRDPEVLMLDEPTNGLDPAGIVEVRELLRRLGDEGRTVFVSSHLLAEIQAACDRIVIIQRGRLVFEGGIDDLLAQSSPEVVVRPELLDDVARLAELVGRHGHEVVRSGDALRVVSPIDSPVTIHRIAVDAGIELRELREHTDDLEDIFLSLTRPETPSVSQTQEVAA